MTALWFKRCIPSSLARLTPDLKRRDWFSVLCAPTDGACEWRLAAQQQPKRQKAREGAEIAELSCRHVHMGTEFSIGPRGVARRASCREARRAPFSAGRRPRRASRRPPRRAYRRIIVGDVSSWRLARGSIAKSVLDAGWGMIT